jgi:uncharacterized OB-fold protein
MNEVKRPLPALDPVSAPYWEAAARGELLHQVCPSCGHRQLYPRAACTACGAEPGWARSSGRGVVHTFTVIRQNPAPPWGEMVPYVVAVVELEEGVRLMSNVTDCAPEDVRIGMRVEVHFERPEPDVGIPLFKPASNQREE